MEIRLAPHGRHVVVVTIDNQPRRNAMINSFGRHIQSMASGVGRFAWKLAYPSRSIVLDSDHDRQGGGTTRMIVAIYADAITRGRRGSERQNGKGKVRWSLAL